LALHIVRHICILDVKRQAMPCSSDMKFFVFLICFISHCRIHHNGRSWNLCHLMAKGL